MDSYDVNDMKHRLTAAIGCLFSQCLTHEEYQVAQLAVVEFITAFSLSPEDAIEVMQNAQGIDAETDKRLDDLISSFSEEIE